MPIAKIETNEYTCRKCGHKWINRVNGKDRPVPKRCASCKRSNWDTEGITAKEAGLRRRIRGYKILYKHVGWSEVEWSDELVERFLKLQPRPSVQELARVVFPPGLTLAPLDSQNQYSWRGWIPVPEKPGYFKYDVKEYIELRRQEAHKRQEIMRQIIKARNQI